MNEEYLRDKEHFIKNHKKQMKVNSLLINLSLERCGVPKVMIDIIVDYSQNLIDVTSLDGFETFWKHARGERFICISCDSDKTVLFNHNSIESADTICERGHVEIEFQIPGKTLYFKHNLFENDVEDGLIVAKPETISVEELMQYEPQIRHFMQNIDKKFKLETDENTEQKNSVRILAK